MRRRYGLLLGGVAAIGYIVVAMLSFNRGLVPTRPLYDGTAPPPPYRWVKPPSDLADTNQPPDAGSGTVAFTNGESANTTVPTNDGQAIVAFQQGSFKPLAGQTSAKVTITPIDPATVGPSPAGYDYDGNAYRVNATYAPSGTAAEIAPTTCPTNTQTTTTKCPTVVLRFPLFGTELFRYDDTAWTHLEAHTSPTSLQVFADTPKLGVFAVAGVSLPPVRLNSSKVGLYLAIGLGAGAFAVGVVTWRSKRTRRSIVRFLLRKKKPPERPRSASRGPAPPRGVQKKRRKR